MNFANALLFVLAVKTSAVNALAQTASITHYLNKPDLGLAGTVKVKNLTDAVGFTITGEITGLPASTTGNYYIGSESNCNIECDALSPGVFVSPCLGGSVVGGETPWEVAS